MNCTNLAVVRMLDTVEQEIQLIVTASARHFEFVSGEEICELMKAMV